MHLNYHFLRYLAPALSHAFSGYRITACFSQSKGELVIETQNGKKIRYIRAHLLPSQVYLSFPESFARAKRNSANLFGELIGNTLVDCRVLAYERTFVFGLDSGGTLLFKLHGNRSNILLFGENDEPALFRNNMQEDRKLSVSDLENPLDLSRNRFDELDGDASRFLPTLGAVPRAWLKDRDYLSLDLGEKWLLMEELIDLLEAPLFSLTEKKGDILLTLLPEPNALRQYSDPIQASNELFHLALVRGNFDKEKNLLLKSHQDQLRKTRAYLSKAKTKLNELKNAPPPSQLADIIMAYLHKFQAGKTEIELLDFYSGKKVKVVLKKNQKPQDLAENLYRKSKNRQIELDQIEKNILSKEDQNLKLKQKITELEAIKDFKELRAFQKDHKKSPSNKKNANGLPYRQFKYEGYIIWVGKSAKGNDEMLRGHIHKDDLWLHARQVPGSHVVIRTKGMPSLTGKILERAAGLAAFYSKLKSDSLAPVIYTEAKYVRKAKGSAPGSVIVDREKVIMVPPLGPGDDTSDG